jgi:hypothetical protein
MTDYNRPVSEVTDPTPTVHRSRLPTTGPIFESLDVVAGIVAAVMVLGPLAMAAFWAPYH